MRLSKEKGPSADGPKPETTTGSSTVMKAYHMNTKSQIEVLLVPAVDFIRRIADCADAKGGE